MEVQGAWLDSVSSQICFFGHILFAEYVDKNLLGPDIVSLFQEWLKT